MIIDAATMPRPYTAPAGLVTPPLARTRRLFRSAGCAEGRLVIRERVIMISLCN
jgi:hypothetical protein